jgi:hypothetical protein
MMRSSTLLLACLGLATQLPAQNVATARFAKPTSMQSDRIEDSYAIYSQLLKSGPIEWRDARRSQWLVEDTTHAVSLDAACKTASGLDPMAMDPHHAVQPPADREADWNEVLADYDQHCHDVIRLDRQSFRTELPVRLLSAEDRQNFMKDPGMPPAGFADAAGLHRFTEVFFNADHTLALVEEGMWCGFRCGNWTWVALEREADGWTMLPWVRTSVVS